MKKYFSIIIFTAIIFTAGCSSTNKISTDAKDTFKVSELNSLLRKKKLVFPVPNGSGVDTVIIDSTAKKIDLYLNKEFSTMEIREENSVKIKAGIKNYFEHYFEGYKLNIFVLKRPLDELIPNFYRSDKSKYDKTRMPLTKLEKGRQVITNASKPYSTEKGLQDINIGLWHSHGWYYNNELDRWEWERPRLFQTCEDFVPMSFTVPYLIPMLENAGANVYVPRERDIQTNEVVIDNDSEAGKTYIEKSNDEYHKWKTGEGAAFAKGKMRFTEKDNPFLTGTHRIIESDIKESATAEYIPDIPEAGEYGIYISYKASDKNVSDASFSVCHSGGITNFLINQKIGGSTWFYLGKFKFKKGTNPEAGKLVVSNKSKETGGIISVDAVRFGGGMSVVERNGKISGRPKFAEGSRYWLQYAGMPDTLVYSLNNLKDDYKDDYQCRNEYLNYLYGAPYGPNVDRKVKGLGIPIDISMAFHTDAGITHNDTTVGTLSIYSIEDAKGKEVFPDGVSRMANRDLADIIQTEIVRDVRKDFDPAWNRRQLHESQYSESYRPNFPTILLELLSHQNLLDMKFFHDPAFRFTVSRSIYKGMLKFLSAQYSLAYVVQPLPVTSFSTEFDKDGNVNLKWLPVADTLEPSAQPEKYVVYTRINDNGFDNGFVVENPEATIKDIKPGIVYSYKITAINKGGESFPSEILSVGKAKEAKGPVLIVNGFDRISGPAVVETKSFSGFMNNIDAGVPDKLTFNFTGVQNDFDPKSEWKTNDNPGHGASYADFETKEIAGNTFDFPLIHGKAILNAGYSFVSSSCKSVLNNQVDMNKYKFVDLILGEQKETPRQKKSADSIMNAPLYKAYPRSLQSKLTAYSQTGGNLFISGAYTATELYADNDSLDMSFAKNILKINSSVSHAAKTGKVNVLSSFKSTVTDFNYCADLNKYIYQVEAPDAIEPVKESKTILRYSENLFSAGIAYKKDYGVIVTGFPFETITEDAARNEFMKAILQYLDSHN